MGMRANVLRLPGEHVLVPAGLLLLAGAGWVWSVRMASMPGEGMLPAHTMSLSAFVLAWAAMMAAMMFPAIIPVVRLYARAAAAGNVAPFPFFAAAYLVVWSIPGIPAFWAWRALEAPLAAGSPAAGRLAGGVLAAAAIWQLTPVKAACLQHCRSPLSFFMQHGNRLTRPTGAFRMGAWHAVYCLGCCWALMVVLVAFGTMSLWWMLGLAVLIFLEKNVPRLRHLETATAVVFAAGGLALLVHPPTIAQLV